MTEHSSKLESYKNPIIKKPAGLSDDSSKLQI